MGVSVKSPQDARIILNNFKEFNFIQLNFNLVDQRAIDFNILDLALKKSIINCQNTFLFWISCLTVKLKKRDHKKKMVKKTN